jgi:hypothetical protein
MNRHVECVEGQGASGPTLQLSAYVSDVNGRYGDRCGGTRPRYGDVRISPEFGKPWTAVFSTMSPVSSRAKPVASEGT